MLRRRRAEIFETVAAEIDFGDFDRSIEDDFDPFAEVPPQTELADVFEMLMIDLALSSEITGEPFQTPTEVRVIKQRASQRGLLFAAITVEIAACLGSALATVLALWAGARAPIVVGIAAMALSAGSLVALRVWDQAGSTRWPRGALAVAEAATFLFGLALIINWWEQKPLLRPDVFWPTAVGLAGAFWLVPLFFSVLVVLGFRRSTSS